MSTQSMHFQTIKEVIIDKLPINQKFRNVLEEFSNVMLTTMRGFQKDTSVRELTECIFWITNEYLKNNSLEHISSEENEPEIDFFEFADTKEYYPEMNESLKEIWNQTQSYDADIFLRVQKKNKQVRKLLESKFFPYGVTRAQVYFIEGVIENYQMK